MICNLNIYSSKSYTCEFNNIGDTEKKALTHCVRTKKLLALLNGF